jgi:ABC-type branched-subunit amino acid transport system ATPase component
VPKALSIADRVYVMQRGRIAFESSSKDLTGRLSSLKDVYLGRQASSPDGTGLH